MNQSAKVTCIQASECNVTGKAIFTLECEYPLDIHAQLLTHGVFSKNSSSCRAIPIATAVENLRANPAKKIWTAKNKGMQGPVISDVPTVNRLDAIHEVYMEQAIAASIHMDRLGVHKQNAGRYMTPFQNIKIVLTSTEWENWDWLRNDEAAQPEIRELAQAMKEARDNAEIMSLNAGEWHVPYVERNRNIAGELEYFIKSKVSEQHTEYTQVTLVNAINISMSCCAQVSYRKSDNSLAKAEDMFEKLFSGKKIHASPAEHQATPINADFHGEVPDKSLPEIMSSLPKGITAIDTNLQFRSGNFINWVQNRQLIQGHDQAIKPKKNLEELILEVLFTPKK